MPYSHNDYDEEPVVYCAKCYSLKIKYEEAVDADCCMECGSTETATASIEEWEKLYEKRYGHPYVEKQSDPKESIFFRMPLRQLKTTLYQSKLLRPVIRRLYPDFPKGLSSLEAIMVLFDRLSKDGKIDDLRYLLYNFYKNTNLKYKDNGRERSEESFHR